LKKKELQHFDALVDTSSVVAHDLCAQLHVLQFCTEELDSFISPDGRKYLEKVQESSKYLASLINSFRNQLKFDFSKDQKYTIAELNSFVNELLKNHFYGVIDKISLDVNQACHDKYLKNRCADSVHMIFALYSIVVDLLKSNSYFLSNELSIRLAVENNSLVISFSGENFNISKDRFEKEMRMSTPDKGSIRKYLGIDQLNKIKSNNDQVLVFHENPDSLEIKLQLEIE
tara:strand:+ start:103863 stop:104552 length:690 start_codon:yes stop_codon:yes gene_type:complete